MEGVMEKQKKKIITRFNLKKETVKPEMNRQSKLGHYYVLPDFLEEEDDVYDGKL
jgi:hypothetical protein